MNNPNSVPIPASPSCAGCACAHPPRTFPKIQFTPPIAVQRYTRVAQILEQELDSEASASRVEAELNKLNLNPMAMAMAAGQQLQHELGADGDHQNLKTILEVGCAGLHMHSYLRELSGVGKLIYLDLDHKLIKDCQTSLWASPAQLIDQSETPLVAELYSGCITRLDPTILQDPLIDVVVAIEVIEHLEPDVLAGFENSVFGVISPPLVVLTTPNIEFNTVFNMVGPELRHWDHKFEWTRAEFKAWCQKICQRFPGYEYEVEGIGQWSRELSEEFGCVSQMAVFKKTCQIVGLNSNHCVKAGQALGILGEKGSYKLVARIEYPWSFDPSPLEDQILSAFDFHIENYLLHNNSNLKMRLNKAKTKVKLPLSEVVKIQGIPKKGRSVRKVMEALTSRGHLLQCESCQGHGPGCCDDNDVYVVIPMAGLGLLGSRPNAPQPRVENWEQNAKHSNFGNVQTSSNHLSSSAPTDCCHGDTMDTLVGPAHAPTIPAAVGVSAGVRGHGYQFQGGKFH